MSTLQQVISYTKTVVEATLRKEITDYIIEIYQEMFRRTVYSLPEGDNYERTMSAYDATRTIINNTGSGHSIELFSDPNFMVSDYPSWVEGGSQDNKDSIVNWLNYGTSSPYFSHPAHNFIGLSEAEISKKLNSFFIKTLRSKGLRAK